MAEISHIELDFAGDFIDMLSDDEVSLAEKREEIQGYRQVSVLSDQYMLFYLSNWIFNKSNYSKIR